MARNVSEIEINSETPREDLELCVIAAERTSDPNTQRAAARARAELWRREQQAWIERFNAESEERVKAQRFQEAQITRQIEAQESSMSQQLEVAKEQGKAANKQVCISWLSAGAALLAAVAAIALAFMAYINLP